MISASVDFASDQITIVGRNLPRQPSVKLGGTDLGDPISASATEIVASLANVAGIENQPGDYLLSICGTHRWHHRDTAADATSSDRRDDDDDCEKRGHRSCDTKFIVSVGAAGQPGPQGEKRGDKGDKGDVGRRAFRAFRDPRASRERRGRRDRKGHRGRRDLPVSSRPWREGRVQPVRL